jgi:hypothetical protein
MTKINKSALSSCAGGVSALAVQHLLCPNHGTLALGAKALVVTGAVGADTLESHLTGIEHVVTGSLESMGMSDAAAHRSYHATTDYVLPALGWALLAHSGYSLARSYLSRRQSVPAAEDPIELHPLAYRPGEQ